MAQILDKQGLQHYANKMCNADNRKVGSKNLPTALNEIDIAIDGFKTLFETEYGTPVNMELENNENVFSIGTGINIDKKDDVENSFTDVELSGSSLVNLADEWKDVTNETISFYYGADRCICKTSKLKNNTYYTLIANYKINLNNTTAYDTMELGLSNSKDSVLSHPSKGETNYAFNVKDGLNVIKFHLSDYKHDEYAYFNIRPIRRGTEPVEGESVTFSCSDLILLEGDWTNKPIPQYFEGLKSVGEKEDGNHKISISSVGKNLFNINENPSKEINSNHNIKINDFNGYDIIAKNDNSGWIYSTFKHKIILKPNKDYRISCDIYKSNQNSKACIRLYSSSLLMSLGTLYSSGYVTFRTPSVVDDFYLLLYSSIDDIPCKSGDVFSYRNIQIEVVSDSNNDYSPFRIDKKEISLNEPLRGLPNGVKDTIEKINGEWKIVRRCGQDTLNGNSLTSFSVGSASNSSTGEKVGRMNFLLNEAK